MNLAAQHVVKTLPDIVVAYGVSDEYSFVFHRSTTLFERRNAKLVSTVVSTFTAAYVMLWSSQFEAEKEMMQLQLDMLLPTFDARAVCYPTWENLRDYLSWRQVDCMYPPAFLLCAYHVHPEEKMPQRGRSLITNMCAPAGHINNLYNTTFWALVQQGGMSQTAAEEFLKGTVASDKNEILWSKFGVNYNNEPEMFRKGSVVYREYALETQTPVKTSTEQQQEEEEVEEDDLSRAADEKRPISKTQAEKMRKARQKAKIVTTHVDIIKDDFWLMRPWLRSGKPGRPIEPPSTSPSQLN